MAENLSSPDNVELHLPSVLGYEKIARRAAEAVAEQMDFAPERIEDLKTAVAEACMNAIEHGNNENRAIHVTVQMLIMPDKLEVRVADVGHHTMPDQLPPPGSGDMRGWGMFFIQNLVDEMQITRLPDGGNEVRMTLYLAPQSEESEADGSDSQPSPTETSPTAVLPVETKPSTVLPVEEKPSAVLPREEKPSAVLPVEAKPSAILPAEEKPSAVLPAEVKPMAILPAEEKPSAVLSAEVKPAAIQPAGSHPSAPEQRSASSSVEVQSPQES
ncbi:MAG: ATP-binding protein [Chloroflexi bacterium]|nr:ATP-binding protein [Chloroflexota bacterium]